MKKILVLIIMTNSFIFTQDNMSKIDEVTELLKNSNVDFSSTEVSIIELISNPKKYHNEKIIVSGVINIQFEGNALYLSFDDYTYRLGKNAIWLSITDEYPRIEYNVLEQFSGKYVRVRGVFNKNSNGHFDGYSGSIHKITSIESLKKSIFIRD